ncbi:hypothetical protein C3489_17070 [Streptomyces sp. Ru71]|uniref:septum formation initiator family protein n=1 Tax=Streptomyces sp. Ru71 TaxID=2080746 RepID=UPI000CDE533B|nr:septum formation initiator family protein [Streptomyces sp. Ru71]POX52959.1 hypothetical protein C3489_17070 [Streptomyces sp. Ru71]
MSGKPEVKGRAARLARLFPAAGAGQAARTPFVLLVVLLLGGGLIGLLVLNSALSEGSFKMDDLQKETKSLTDEEQALQRDVDAYSAPEALQRRARELGMVPGGDPAFLDPDGTVKGVPSPAAAEREPVPLVLAPEMMPTGTAQPPAPGASGTAAPATSAAPGPKATTPPASPTAAPATAATRPTPTTTPGR